MTIKKQSLFTFLLLLAAVYTANAQYNYIGQFNPITTAVPFLTIAPDARGGSMGDVGVSSEPDVFSMHYNPAKYAFIKKDMGLGISYSPWLKGLTNDINLAYLSAFKRIDKNQVVAMSLRYFNLGDITFMDENGYDQGSFRPNEFAVDATYSRFLTNTLSMAVAARYIHSNLTQNQDVQGQATKPGNSVAADVSLYQRFPVEFDQIEGNFSWGLNISNIGTKISYSDDKTYKDFIPTNLKIGPSLTLDLDDYNQLSFNVDINKLLVPTPSIDTNGIVIAGMETNVSVPVGMIHSFYDAPGELVLDDNGKYVMNADGMAEVVGGSVFKEELSEINFATSVEYWYAQQFAVRGGFFWESQNKGNRKYFTLGAGFRYNVIGIDFSYLIPLEQQNPLANTLRFSLLINFDAPSNR